MNTYNSALTISIRSRHSATNKEIRKKATRSNEKLPSSEDITTSVDCNKNFTFTKIDPTNNGGEAWDFCIWGEEQRATDRTVLASYQWQAPELFNTTNSTSVRPCLGSDIYSMGLVVLECCTGCVPWRGVSLQEISKKYRNSESVDIPAKVDNKYTNLIIKATVLKPKLRILTVSDFMEELQTNFQGADDLDVQTPYQNENFGSHSRLQSILIQNRTISQTEPEESYFNHQEDTYNIDDCFNKTQDSIDKKQSNMQKYYTELNANKIEFSDEDVRRMTCSDFLDELKRQTEDLKTKNQSYNMFSSPLVNESNNSQYYSMNDKTNLTNTVLSPIVDGDSNPKGKFLLNITPKFYTPLQIQTPVTDLSVTNYNNAKSQDSVYSFDIEDYELPETPIARNTKIRKNAWLSEPKHKNTSQNLNETRNISENFNGTKNFSDAFVNPGEVYEEMERLRDDINKTFDKILENQQSEELIKKHISPKLLHSEKSDADEVFSTPEAEELIKKHISPKLLHSEKSDADEVFSTPEANSVNQGSESVRAIRRRERLARINNVKTKLNDMLSKSLTCGASCMTTSTPSRIQSSSLNYDIGQKERLQASPVKPASHSRETTFVLQNQNWTRDSKFSRFPNLSPPYNVEAIKPANHHDECNTLPRDHITSSGRQSPTVVEISDEAKKVQHIQQQAAIDHFENSLWKMEKNKCELKRADFIANNMDKDLKASSTQTADDKIDSCEEISEHQVEENCLNIYEQPIIDNYDANMTRDNEKVDQIQQDQNNSKLDAHNLDTSEKSLVPKMASDDILDCVHDFNEKLFIDEATLESNAPDVPIPESTLPKPNNSSTLPKSSTARFSDYFPLTDFSRYTTLPSKISTRIIVAPDRGFFSQICRKETQSPINRRVSVLEIAKIFEKRSRDSRNEKLSHDSSLSRQRTRQMSFRRNVKEFEKMNVNKSEVFSAEVASEAEFLKNRKSSEFPEFGKRLDQSFIYNNALEEKDAEDADKVCTHCGSHVNPPETTSKNQQRESLGRRLTLSPELADLCANLLRDQFADLDARYLLSSAIDLAQNGGSLRRCQAFAAIQDARSIEDLYIDDEFTSEEQLGSHMQLFSCRNSHDDILDCSTTSSLADSFDIYYREDDFYPEVNLEEYPLSIDLTQEGDENSADGAEEAVDNSLGKDQDNDQVKDQGKDQGKDQFGFEPRLTQILEENSDCESEDSLRRRKYTDEEEMESSL
ncbi:uncharacterized protein LOC113367738 [Ctenocephalides felis]|uniref:uncharacterized protein LOC113367738 n=1 Tax=Ctenocephalides felis TaxID=7515 RepID=UPI000E6E1068|nr:uncharacterized protein LOC113367738 [Ctenocephalides felis]